MKKKFTITLNSDNPKENELIEYLSTKGHRLSKDVADVLYKDLKNELPINKSDISLETIKSSLLKDEDFLKEIITRLSNTSNLANEEIKSGIENEQKKNVEKEASPQNVNEEIIMKGLEMFQ